MSSSLCLKSTTVSRFCKRPSALAIVPGTQCRGNTWSSLIPAHVCPLPPLCSIAKMRTKPYYMNVRETQGNPSSFQSTEPTFKVSDCDRIFALRKPFPTGTCVFSKYRIRGYEGQAWFIWRHFPRLRSSSALCTVFIRHREKCKAQSSGGEEGGLWIQGQPGLHSDTLPNKEGL